MWHYALYNSSGEGDMRKTEKNKPAQGLLVQRENEKEMRVIKMAINKQFESIKLLDLAIMNDISVKKSG